MYGGGLRLSELVNMDCRHVDLDSGEVWVVGKAAIHHFQHRPVAHRQRIVKVDLQQLIHFININVFRQMARFTRRHHPFGRIGGRQSGQRGDDAA